MTMIEAALSTAWPSNPDEVTFGYFAPTNGKRVDDPPPIAVAIRKAGSRHISWAGALPAFRALGNARAAPVTIHTKGGGIVLAHDGAGWRMG